MYVRLLTMVGLAFTSSVANAGLCNCRIRATTTDVNALPGETYTFDVQMENLGSNPCLFDFEHDQFAGDGTINLSPSIPSQWIASGGAISSTITSEVPAANSAMQVNRIRFRALVEGTEECRTNGGSTHNVCIIPEDVSAATTVWNGIVASGHDFEITLSPSTTTFETRTVKEVVPGIGIDGCYALHGSAPGCPNAFNNVTGGEWTVESDNTLDLPDTIGYLEACANHFDTALAAGESCGTTIPQDWEIDCPGMSDVIFASSNPDIGADIVHSGIPSSTTIKARSNGVEATKSWP